MKMAALEMLATPAVSQSFQMVLRVVELKCTRTTRPSAQMYADENKQLPMIERIERALVLLAWRTKS
jgi:hypothetical protein